MKVIFMGTPSFAVPCLERLIEKGYDVQSVFTQPDKPVGRKRIMTSPPVKVLAEEKGIPVYQLEKMKDGKAFKIIESFNTDIIVVVAYGKILPKEIIDYPKYGCINIHGSLLPKLRGAAPIQWSVINGEKFAGVTSMRMNEGLDTGDIILKKEVEIDFEETSGQLYDRLSFVGADVLEETLELIESNVVVYEKQDDFLSSYAPLLNKQMSVIDWQNPAIKIYNKIRGLNPWPIAQTILNGKTLKIYAAKYIENVRGNPGELIIQNKRMIVCCGDDNAIEILSLQLEGKKMMDTKSFLSGGRINEKTILGV